MRKIFLLILLALLFLSACGAPGAGEGPAPTAAETPVVAETPAPTPVPTPEPALSLLPDAGPLPDYIPPMGFEPVSVWEAEPFGDGGQALLYMGEETDGVTPFKVFSCFNFTQRPLETAFLTETSCFEAEAVADGSWHIEYKDGWNMLVRLQTSALDGSLTIDGDMLTLSYSSATPLFTEGQTEYSLDSAQPKISMPKVPSDDLWLVHYLPTQFSRLDGSLLGQAMYSMPAFDIELNEAMTSLRGLKAGSSLPDILARFPNCMQIDPRCICAPEGCEVWLYGGHNGACHMRLIYCSGDRPYMVRITAYSNYVDIILDRELMVSSIEYNAVTG